MARTLKATAPLKSIRAWAKKNGHNVSDRGRLPAEVLQAWQTAQAAMSKA